MNVSLCLPYEDEYFCGRQPYGIIGPTRECIPTKDVAPTDSTKIFIFRDPRDLVVSRYISFTFVHATPPTAKWRNTVLDERKQNLEEGFCGALIRYIHEMKIFFRPLMTERENYASDLHVIPYEFMIADTPKFINLVCNLSVKKLVPGPGAKQMHKYCVDELTKTCLKHLFCKPGASCDSNSFSSMKELEELAIANKTHKINPLGRYWKILPIEQQTVLNVSFAEEVREIERLLKYYRALPTGWDN
jgi:hypothetical protein